MLLRVFNQRLVRIAKITNFSQGHLSIANAGDFNRDGIRDLVIGDPDANGGLGIAYVRYGANEMPASTLAELIPTTYRGTGTQRSIGHERRIGR